MAHLRNRAFISSTALLTSVPGGVAAGRLGPRSPRAAQPLCASLQGRTRLRRAPSLPGSLEGPWQGWKQRYKPWSKDQPLTDMLLDWAALAETFPGDNRGAAPWARSVPGMLCRTQDGSLHAFELGVSVRPSEVSPRGGVPGACPAAYSRQHFALGLLRRIRWG